MFLEARIVRERAFGVLRRGALLRWTRPASATRSDRTSPSSVGTARDGRWLDATSLGRFSTEPLLAVDTRGRVRALWRQGEWYVDHVNCCHALKSKLLP